MVAEVVAPEAFGEVSINRAFVIQRDGRDVVLVAGLVQGLVQLSGGHFDVQTEVVQLPTAENAQTAVCTCRVTVFDPEDGRLLRVATGIGDASPGNVARHMAPHILRLAETRALGRALRHLGLGAGMVALEELGEDVASQGPETREPAHTAAANGNAPVRPSWGTPAPPETIQLEGRTFTRPQVLGIYGDRLAEARRVGLQLAPEGAPGGPPLNTAPLPDIVRFSSELKRRLEVRSSAK